MQQTNSAGSSFFNSGRPHILFRTIIHLGNASTVVLLHPRLTLEVFSIGMQTGTQAEEQKCIGSCVWHPPVVAGPLVQAGKVDRDVSKLVDQRLLQCRCKATAIILRSAVQNLQHWVVFCKMRMIAWTSGFQQNA